MKIIVEYTEATEPYWDNESPCRTIDLILVRSDGSTQTWDVTECQEHCQ